MTPTIHTASPYFSWTKSTDTDPVDSSLQYELIIAEDVGFNQIAFQTDNIYDTVNSVVTYQLTNAEQLQKAVLYYWKVRSYDGKQYSSWSNIHSFVLARTNENLTAKVMLAHYWYYTLNGSLTLVSPSQKDLSASLNVVHDRLNAEIFIIQENNNNLSASVNLVNFGNVDLPAFLMVGRSSFYDLSAKIRIPVEDLRAAINIDTQYQQLSAKINIIQDGNTDLSASVTIVKTDLSAKLVVIQYGDHDLSGRLMIQQELTNDLSAQLFIRGVVDLNAKITVFRQGDTDLMSRVDVTAIKPSDVIVDAFDQLDNHVPENTWQTEQNITFKWTESTNPYFDIEYYGQWNNISDHEITDADVNYGTDRETVKSCYSPEKWYFHVRARNSNGCFAEHTSHYGVWYNHKPTNPNSPFYVNGLTPGVSCVVLNGNPVFQWNNSNDDDSEDIVKYELQITRDNSFINIEYEYLTISEGVGTYTEYQLPISEKLLNEGEYYFRVRAFDNKEYSDYVYGGYFNFIRSKINLLSEINIVSMSYSSLSASIYIKEHKDLSAEINVLTRVGFDLSAKINMVKYFDYPLKAKLFIQGVSNLSAQLTVLPYVDLSAKIIITQSDHSDLRASLAIVETGYRNLRAKIFLGTWNDVDLSARLAIRSNNDLLSKLFVWSQNTLPYWENLSARLLVEKNNYQDLKARIEVVADKPGPVILSANIPENEWQEENNIHFTWLPAQQNIYPVQGYYYVLDKYPDTLPTGADRSTSQFELDFDLENYSGSGEYYFHINAYNSIGNTGETTHFHIKYNHKPPVPNLPMLINGLDSYSDVPIIGNTASQVFNWGGAIDQDPLDLITYELQLADNSNFYNVIIHKHNLSGTTLFLDVSELVPKGKYYWRIRCYDGYEFGEWGYVASFIVNTPPPAPENLYVLQ